MQLMIGLQCIGSFSVLYIASFFISEAVQEEGMQVDTYCKDYEIK